MSGPQRGAGTSRGVGTTGGSGRGPRTRPPGSELRVVTSDDESGPQPPAKKSGSRSSAPKAAAPTAPTSRQPAKRTAAPGARNPAARNSAAKNPVAKNPVTKKTAAKKTAARSTSATSGAAAVRGTRAPTRRPLGTAVRPPRLRRPTLRPVRPADPVRRLHASLLALVFVLTIFAGRLVQMQGLDAPAVADEALGKRSATMVLAAHRGDITDVHNVPLATTVDRRNVLVDQTQVPRYQRLGPDGRRVTVGVAGAAQDLARVLNLPPATLAARLTGSSRGAYLVRDIAPDVAREVIRLPIPGINLEQASRRTYPAGTTAANVLGFVSSTTGRVFGGIEAKYDPQLAGRSGLMTYERGRDGTRIPTGLTKTDDPVPGSTIRLTLDRDLQWRAQQLIEERLAEVEGESATVVVLDAKTFDVLALATSPTFDPNDPGEASVADRGNRPLEDVFEPGSTAKVITLAAALEEGKVTPTTRLTIPSQLKRADRTFRDSEEHGTEKLTVAGVLAQSSNMGTILAGERVSSATLFDYQTKFGLGRQTGVGLPEAAGKVDPWQQWSGSQRYTVMFGQGMSVTALQAAGVYATIANDGVRRQPRLVAGQTGPDGVYHPTVAGAETRVISPQTAKNLRAMMENVVGDSGTAAKAEVPGYRVAGKTGTSDAYDASCHCYRGYTASFIGMAPADDPELVIAVIVEKPVKGHYGGQVAAPVFSELMTYALAERKIPPTGTTPPEIPLRWR